MTASRSAVCKVVTCGDAIAAVAKPMSPALPSRDKNKVVSCYDKVKVIYEPEKNKFLAVQASTISVAYFLLQF